MFAILYALGMAVADLIKSRARLEAEILLLRHGGMVGSTDHRSVPLGIGTGLSRSRQ